MQSRIQPSSELLGYYRFSPWEIDAAVSFREVEAAISRRGDLRIAHPFKGGIASQIPKVLEGRLSHNSIGPNSRTAESAAGRGPGGRRIQQADGLVRGVIGGGQCSVETFQRGEIVLNGSGG